MRESNLPEPRDPYLAAQALKRVLCTVDVYRAEIGYARILAQVEYATEHPGRQVYLFKVTEQAVLQFTEAPAPYYVAIDGNNKWGQSHRVLPPDAHGVKIVEIESPAVAPTMLRDRLNWLISQIPSGTSRDRSEAGHEDLHPILRTGDINYVRTDVANVLEILRGYVGAPDPAEELQTFCDEIERRYRSFRVPGRAMSALYLLAGLLTRKIRQPTGPQFYRDLMHDSNPSSFDDFSDAVVSRLVRVGDTALVFETGQDLLKQANAVFETARDAINHQRFVSGLFDAHPFYEASYSISRRLMNVTRTFESNSKHTWVPPETPLNRPSVERDKNFCDERRARIMTTLGVDFDTWNDVEALPYRRDAVAAAYQKGLLHGDQLMSQWLKAAMLFPPWWEAYLCGTTDEVPLEAPPGFSESRHCRAQKGQVP
jgi:hypothetical protein